MSGNKIFSKLIQNVEETVSFFNRLPRIIQNSKYSVVFMILLNSNEFATRLSAFFSWKCVSHLSREYHLSEIGSVRRGARENEQEERRQRLKRLKKNYSFLYTTTYFKKVIFRETHEKSILKVATISRLLTASRYLRNYNDPKFS